MPERSSSFCKSSTAPKELRELAGLELNERRPLRELIAVRQKKDELRHRIRVLGIQVPWMKTALAKNPISEHQSASTNSTT